MWEQSLLAMQAPQLMRNRIDSIAGKLCSHRGELWVYVLLRIYLLTTCGDIGPAPNSRGTL